MEQTKQFNPLNQTSPISNFKLPGRLPSDTKMLFGAVLFLLLAVFIFRNGVPRQQEAAFIAPFLKNAEVAEPLLTSRAYLIRRMNTGEVLLEKEKDAPLPIASITKLFTADLFSSYFQNPLEPVQFFAEALQKKFSDEKLSGIAAGERVKTEDILWLMLVASANDAARSAAEATALRAFPDLQSASFSERIAAFVRMLNERALILGLTHTHFTNPDGLDDAEHYSSAQDLYIFIKTLMTEKPELLEISRRVALGVASESGIIYRFDNTNRILAKYPKIIASKTGSTAYAKETLVLVYELFPDDPVFIALLGSDNRDADAEVVLQWLETAFVKQKEVIK